MHVSCIVLHGVLLHRSDISPYLGDDPNISAKPWKPKEQPKPVATGKDDDFETEWDDVLQQASEEELVDLAGNYLPYLVQNKLIT